MEKVTELQKAMLHDIARSEYTSVNGQYPETEDETGTWANVVIETPADKGVFTTLLTRGLVYHTGTGRDACIGLTEEGFALFKELFPKEE